MKSYATPIVIIALLCIGAIGIILASPALFCGTINVNVQQVIIKQTHIEPIARIQKIDIFKVEKPTYKPIAAKIQDIGQIPVEKQPNYYQKAYAEGPYPLKDLCEC